MAIARKTHSLGLCLGITLLICVATALDASDKNPSIAITTIPHAGPGGAEPIEVIGGVVNGISSKQYPAYRVIVYVHAGGQWWVQPTFESPIISIDPQGKWQTETHLGSVYAALLVKASYMPAGKIGSLPAPSPDGDVLSVIRANGVPASK